MKMATKKQKGLYIRIQMWNGKYKHACGVTTMKSIINNLIIGVTQVSLEPTAFIIAEGVFY
jgi:ribosomal protein L6P/L9E